MEKVKDVLRPVVPENGFGLVSVLVAMVLLAVAVVALSSSSAFLVSLQTDASGRSVATALGVAYMEEVQRRPHESLASENLVRVNTAGDEDQGGAFQRSLTVEADPSVADLLKVTVEVDYPAGLGRKGRVRMETLLDPKSE